MRYSGFYAVSAILFALAIVLPPAGAQKAIIEGGDHSGKQNIQEEIKLKRSPGAACLTEKHETGTIDKQDNCIADPTLFQFGLGKPLPICTEGRDPVTNQCK
jgi:hypothetical protein